MLDLLMLVLCFPISCWLTLWLIGYAHQYSVLDVPDDRSSHSEPTPTGGGLAFVIPFLLYLIWQLLSQQQEMTIITALVISSAVIVVAGYVDDRRPLQVRWRLLAHFFAAAVLLFSLPVLPEIGFFQWRWNEQYSLGLFCLIGLVWILNLFNFMDGIDGIAAVEACTTLFGAALIISSADSLLLLQLLVALMLAVAGFTFFNWPPAKIFMGDVGSGFLGFMLGALALITSASGVISIWSWLILMAVFITDATITLLRRLFDGQRVYQAHRSHAYQILSRRWQSHGKVSLTVLGVNLFWLLPLAWFTSRVPDYGLLLLLIAYAPLLIVVIKVGAGRDRG